mmetsp:Transcript_4606/g.11140  ORF Transcript_4606/g.11140 Transcript_4606/m.11140 type:complete len:321 (+) Transcript_4606:68-1030(+)
MQRSSIIMAMALGLYLLSMVEVTTNFVAGAQLRGATPQLTAPSSARVPLVGAAVDGMRVLAAGLAVSAACMSLQTQRRARTQVRAKADPTMFAAALLKAAKDREEDMQVAQEVLDLKKQFDDEKAMANFNAALLGSKPMTADEAMKSRQACAALATLAATEGKGMEEVMGEVFKPSKGTTTIDAVATVTKMVPNLESSTLPKFLSFINKKDALAQLPEVCKEYASMLYKSQSIAPVLVRSAQALSGGQKKTIEAKMTKRLGVEKVKLESRVEASLIAGLQIEWDFEDPVNLVDPQSREDISFSRAIERAVKAKTGQETLE